MRLRYYVISLLFISFAFLQAGQAQTNPCTLNVTPTSGPYTITVTAAGSCTGAFSYTLDWGDGSSTQSNSGAHRYFKPGTFTVKLTGFNDAGGTIGSATATVVLTNAPPSCTLAVNPRNGSAPLTVTATGNCTDPENDIPCCTNPVVDWGDGSAPQNLNSCDTTCSPFSVQHTYTSPVAKTYTVTVTATDQFGAQGSASQTVTVMGPAPVVASVSPPQGRQGQSIFSTVTGANFVSTGGGTTFDFGSGITVVSVRVSSPTTAVVDFNIGTNAPAGPHDVTATNPGGQKGPPCTGCFTVLVNQPPTCTLTVQPASGTAPLMVTATGQCTDPENDLSQFVINWGDGSPTATFSCDGSCPPINANHTYSTPGTFTVTVTATDFGGKTGSASQQVVVLGPGPTPTSVVPPQAQQGQSLTVRVLGANFARTPQVSFSGTGISVGAVTFVSSSEVDVPITISPTATVGARSVTVTNPDKQSGTCSGCFTVAAAVSPAPNPTSVVPPQASQGQSLAVKILGTNFARTPTVSFSGTGITVGAVTFVSSTEVDVPITISRTATIGARSVTVTNPDKQSGTCSGCFTVVASQAPTCALSVKPSSGTPPLTVTATGNCTDPGGTITSTSLNWGDGTVQNGITSGTHTYTKAGTFTVTVTATNSNGQQGSASQTVTVAASINNPPVCSLSVSPTAGNIPTTVAATGACTDPENDISSIVLRWGDGTEINETNGNHTYTTTGIFTVSVIATDSGGLMGAASQNVTVNQPPVLYVGVSNGQIKALGPSGSVSNTLNTNLGGTTTGMAFDHNGVLYVTDFTAANVSRFDAAAKLLGNFGKGYNCEPESIVFDNAGNAYVGEAGCTHAILKFDPFGNLAAVFNVAVDKQGSDWIDLAADQCTLFYTSEGTTIQRFDVCNNQQLPIFSTGLKRGLAMRLLPGGGALVADKTDILRVDSSGNVQTRYQAPGESCWVGLTLDPDGSSFWAADFCSSDIVKFDIASGSQLAKKSAVNAPNSVFSVAIRTPLPQSTSAGTFIASPETVAVAAGSPAHFSLDFIPSVQSVNQTLPLFCSGLPVGAQCLFSPSAFLVGTNALTDQLTITTGGPSKMAASHMPTPLGPQLPFNSAWTPVSLGLLSFGLGWWRKKGTMRTALLLAVILIGVAGCVGTNRKNSNGPITSSTPAGTYLVTVQAGSGALQSSTVVKLVVQ